MLFLLYFSLFLHFSVGKFAFDCCLVCSEMGQNQSGGPGMPGRPGMPGQQGDKKAQDEKVLACLCSVGAVVCRAHQWRL